jgi:DNA-binding NarL/FixJ family response regulator
MRLLHREYAVRPASGDSRADGRGYDRGMHAEPVDVVLMDIRMPDGDGLWATEQIAAGPVLAGVGVVVVTTFELDEYVARARCGRAGASGFLVKDTEPEDLVRAVRAVAAGEGLLSPGVTRRLLDRLATGLREAPDPRALALAPELQTCSPQASGPHHGTGYRLFWLWLWLWLGSEVEYRARLEVLRANRPNP